MTKMLGCLRVLTQTLGPGKKKFLQRASLTIINLSLVKLDK